MGSHPNIIGQTSPHQQQYFFYGQHGGPNSHWGYVMPSNGQPPSPYAAVDTFPAHQQANMAQQAQLPTHFSAQQPNASCPSVQQHVALFGQPISMQFRPNSQSLAYQQHNNIS